MSDQPYLLANAAQEAGSRFDALAELFDAGTQRHLLGIGLTTGWRCWEVGAGGAALPNWMAGVVGTEGAVLATDIDTSWLTDAAEGVEVRTHDVAADPPPEGGGFDLVHARLVLTHVPDRAEAFRRMAGALRPGGWLVIEDFDPALGPAACLEERTDDERLANRIQRGFIDLLGRRGVDIEYGRKLPRLMREAGLRNVSADAAFPVVSAASRLLFRANTMQVAAALVAAGHATADEITTCLTALAAGEIDIATPPLVTARAQR